MSGLHLIPLALVAVLWFSAKGDALTCQEGIFLKVHGDIHAINFTLPPPFSSEMGMIPKLRLSSPDLTVSSNWISRECGLGENHEENGLSQDYVCKETRFCNADVELLFRSCESWSQRFQDENEVERKNDCFQLSDKMGNFPELKEYTDLKDWRIDACICDWSNCNKKWEEESGLCSGSSRIREEFAVFFAIAIVSVLLALPSL